MRTWVSQRPATGGVIVASGQLGHKARIHVWDMATLETISVLRYTHHMGCEGPVCM
jgi:hypothetical protein